MKWSFALVLFIYSSLVFSRVQLVLSSKEASIQQGSLEQGVLQISPEGFQELQGINLQGSTIAKSLYFLQIGPWLRQENSQSFNAEVTFVMIAVPQESLIRDQVKGKELEVELGQLTVRPTEPAPQLLFGTFSVPKKSNWLLWVSIILVGLGLGFFGYKFWLKLRQKRQTKLKLKALKQELADAKSYDDVVMLWKKKTIYVEAFPQLEGSFRKLEETLFRYQFKPRQNEEERAIVLDAYRSFVQESQGALHGI